MSRRDFPRKVKAAAFLRAGGCCEACGAKLKTGEGEVDHILPDILGGEPTLENARVLCRVCHAEKTANDVRAVRKADRVRDRMSGALKGRGFPSRPPRTMADRVPTKWAAWRDPEIRKDGR